MTVPAGAAVAAAVRRAARATTLPLDLPGGTVVSLLVLDRPGGGLTVRPVDRRRRAGCRARRIGRRRRWREPAPAGSPCWPSGYPGGDVAGASRRRRLPLRCAARPGTAAAVRAGSPRRRFRPTRRSGCPRRVRLGAWRRQRAGRRTADGVDTAPDAVRLPGPRPLDPETGTAGWFRAGPAPGRPWARPSSPGTSTASHGPGVFFRFGGWRRGDPVLVPTGRRHHVRFVVTGWRAIPRAAFPTAEVYGPTPDPELRLITCGGRFDAATRSYVDNVVVFARATGVPR